MSFDIVGKPIQPHRGPIPSVPSLGFDPKTSTPSPMCGFDLPTTGGRYRMGLLRPKRRTSTRHHLLGNWKLSAADILCLRSDIDQNAIVNLFDFARLAKNWGYSTFPPVCGDADTPGFPPTSTALRTDSNDLDILSRHWTDTDCFC